MKPGQTLLGIVLYLSVPTLLLLSGWLSSKFICPSIKAARSYSQILRNKLCALPSWGNRDCHENHPVSAQGFSTFVSSVPLIKEALKKPPKIIKEFLCVDTVFDYFYLLIYISIYMYVNTDVCMCKHLCVCIYKCMYLFFFSPILKLFPLRM